MRSVLFALVVCLALAQPYSAASTQTVSGTIVDSTGAALPGVSVTLDASDSRKRTTITNEAGAFRFAAVPIGRVTIAAALAGFQSAAQTLQLAADRPLTARIVLVPSGVQETVTVTGASPGRQAHGQPKAAPAEAPGLQQGVAGGIVGGVAGGSVGNTATARMLRAPSAPWNTEAYDRIEDNAFHKPTDDPLSTFSIDVDTASYTNVRRFLNGGHLPPADAVRTEELINYFRFDYPAPAKGQPFSVTTEVAACPWNAQHRVALIGLHTREIDSAATPPRNLVFLLDVSGSMTPPDKLPLVETAMRMLADTLTASDRIAIVVYAGASGLVLPSTPGDRKETIRRALDQLEAGGSTNGAAGIQLAYDTAAAHFIANGINRVILATNGDFNVGVTSQGELIRLIEEQRTRGIFLSVLGVGTGNLKDSTMEKLADKGNGNYAYLDSLHEARRVLIAQAGATLVTVAKDVKIQVEFNPAAVRAYRLIGYENRILQKEDFNDDKKDSGRDGRRPFHDRALRDRADRRVHRPAIRGSAHLSAIAGGSRQRGRADDGENPVQGSGRRLEPPDHDGRTKPERRAHGARRVCGRDRGIRDAAARFGAQGVCDVAGRCRSGATPPRRRSRRLSRGVRAARGVGRSARAAGEHDGATVRSATKTRNKPCKPRIS
jgi:Ca-activated chloride channel family protein